VTKQGQITGEERRLIAGALMPGKWFAMLLTDALDAVREVLGEVKVGWGSHAPQHPD